MELLELNTDTITAWLPQCVALQAHLVSDPSTIDEQKFIATANAAETYYLGLVDEAKLLGMATLSKMTHPVNVTGYINNVVVSPEARGRGYFGVLMDALESKAKEWGCTDLALTCSRPEVQGMYEKRGYQLKETNFYIQKF